MKGRELGQLVNDFTWYMRNLLLMQSSDEMEEVLDMSADNLAALKEEAQMVSPEVLVRYIRIFSELSNQIKFAAQKRILLEAGRLSNSVVRRWNGIIPLCWNEWMNWRKSWKMAW